MLGKTHETITRADFFCLFAGGCFARRGVPALDDDAAPIGGGARPEAGEDDKGVSSSSSSALLLISGSLAPDAVASLMLEWCRGFDWR